LELLERESYHSKKLGGVKAAKKQPQNPEDEEEAEALERERQEEQAKIDNGR
jgi:hypothetical protein